MKARDEIEKNHGILFLYVFVFVRFCSDLMLCLLITHLAIVQNNLMHVEPAPGHLVPELCTR